MILFLFIYLSFLPFPSTSSILSYNQTPIQHSHHKRHTHTHTHTLTHTNTHIHTPNLHTVLNLICGSHVPLTQCLKDTHTPSTFCLLTKLRCSTRFLLPHHCTYHYTLTSSQPFLPLGFVRQRYPFFRHTFFLPPYSSGSTHLSSPSSIRNAHTHPIQSHGSTVPQPSLEPPEPSHHVFVQLHNRYRRH